MNHILDENPNRPSSNKLLEEKPIAYWEDYLKIFKRIYIVYAVAVAIVGSISLLYFLGLFKTIESAATFQRDMSSQGIFDIFSGLYIMIVLLLISGIIGAVLNIWQIILGVVSFSNYNEKSIHKRYLIYVLAGIILSLVITPMIVMLILPILYHIEIKQAIRKTQMNND